MNFPRSTQNVLYSNCMNLLIQSEKENTSSESYIGSCTFIVHNKCWLNASVHQSRRTKDRAINSRKLKANKL